MIKRKATKQKVADWSDVSLNSRDGSAERIRELVKNKPGVTQSTKGSTADANQESSTGVLSNDTRSNLDRQFGARKALDSIARLHHNVELIESKEFMTVFRKATQGLDDSQKSNYIDTQVMRFMHYLMHDIEDAALRYKEEETNFKNAQNKQQSHSENIRDLLNIITNEIAEHRITDPSSVPHIAHMVENHTVVPQVITQIAKHAITIDQGVEQILMNIQNHLGHNRHDISSSQDQMMMQADPIQKSALNQWGFFGVENGPIAYSQNALSRYRPSPSLLKDTAECPDKRFIRFLLQQGRLPEEDIDQREAGQKDMSHSVLADRIKIVETDLRNQQPDTVQKGLESVYHSILNRRQ